MFKSFEFQAINNEEMRTFECWGSVEVKDRHGEVIPIDKQFYDVMDIWMDRGAPIMFNHTNRQVGKGLNWQPLKKDGKPGVLIKGLIFKHYAEDDEIWKGIKANEFEGLSIGGKAYGREEGNDGTILRNVIGYEFSVVERTGNQEATFEEIAMVKSDDTKEKNAEVFNMAKEEIKKDEIPIETSSKEEVKKEDEQIVEEKPEEETDVKEILSKVLAGMDALGSRVSEIEASLSGKPESEEPVEEKKAEEEEEEKPEEEEKSEEEDEKEDETEKSVTKLQKEVSELKKQLEKVTPAEIITAERPEEVKKEESTDVSKMSQDIALGKKSMSYSEIAEVVRKDREAKLKQKLDM